MSQVENVLQAFQLVAGVGSVISQEQSAVGGTISQCDNSRSLIGGTILVTGQTAEKFEEGIAHLDAVRTYLQQLAGVLASNKLPCGKEEEAAAKAGEVGDTIAIAFAQTAEWDALAEAVINQIDELQSKTAEIYAQTANIMQGAEDLAGLLSSLATE